MQAALVCHEITNKLDVYSKFKVKGYPFKDATAFQLHAKKKKGGGDDRV